MPQITIDFECFKEITRLRPDESVSEGDIIRELLGLGKPTSVASNPTSADEFWESEGVRFAVGTVLEHKFRDGRHVKAIVRHNGIEYNEKIYPGLSPAGVAVTNHQLNGWLFWFVRDHQGALVAADTLRRK